MKSICRIAIAALAALHLVKPFVGVDLGWPIALAAAVTLALGVPLMGGGFRKATAVFLAAGIAALVYADQPPAVWVKAVNALTGVIAIIVVMQTFAIPIRLGDYNGPIRYWLNRMFRRQGPLFLFTSVATHIFTSFLMFGSIPVIVSLLADTVRGSAGHYERFMAAASSRGYALASLWAPGAINLYLVVQATGIGWSEIIVPGMLLSIIGLTVSQLAEARLVFAAGGERRTGAAGEVESVSGGADRYRVVHVLAVVAAIIALTVLFDRLRVGAAYNRIILAGALVVAIWLLAFARQPGFGAAIRGYWENDVLKAVDLAPFFVAMGVFSVGLEHSGLLAGVQTAVQAAAHALGAGSIALLPLLIIVCAVVGIHPFISVVILGKILVGLHLPVPLVTIALCLAVGGAISYMVSPFAGVILTIARLVNARARDVAITWNWVFCAAFFPVGIAFSYYWGVLFG